MEELGKINLLSPTKEQYKGTHFYSILVCYVFEKYDSSRGGRVINLKLTDCAPKSMSWLKHA